MIARIWRGETPAEQADAYAAYMLATGVKEYAETAGNRGAYILRRTRGDRVEFLTLSFWESRDAIRAFAGEEIDRAVYYPEDAAFLLAQEPEVAHFDVHAVTPVAP